MILLYRIPYYYCHIPPYLSLFNLFLYYHILSYLFYLKPSTRRFTSISIVQFLDYLYPEINSLRFWICRINRIKPNPQRDRSGNEFLNERPLNRHYSASQHSRTFIMVKFQGCVLQKKNLRLPTKLINYV